MALTGDAWIGNSNSRDGGGLGGDWRKQEKQILNSTFPHYSRGFGKAVSGKEDAQPC